MCCGKIKPRLSILTTVLAWNKKAKLHDQKDQPEPQSGLIVAPS